MTRQAEWDYRLDELFRAVARVQTPVGPVYLRVLSEAELATRDLKASAAEAEALRAFGPERARASLEAMSRQDLEELALSVRARELARQALESFPPQYVPIPEGADPRERAEALDRRRQTGEELAQQRTAWYEAQLKAAREELSRLGLEELKARAEAAALEAYGRAAFVRAWERWTLYLAAFRDEQCRERLWQEPEDVDRVPRSLRELLLKAYWGLEAWDPFRPDDPGPGRGDSGDA